MGKFWDLLTGWKNNHQVTVNDIEKNDGVNEGINEGVNEGVNEPVKEKDINFKVRVKPFDVECERYVVYYSMDGGNSWDRYDNNFLWKSESMCTKDHPLLFEEFDHAVNFAKSLNREMIYKHLEEKEIDYDHHVKKLRIELEKRNKTWEG